MLYLIRHGETEWNELGRIQGWSDIPLSSQGEVQARQLGHWMRNLKFRRIIASDLARARRTAELIAGNTLSVSTDERLRERSFGSFEGRTLHEIQAELRQRAIQAPEPFDPVDAWPTGTGVEPLEELLSRAGAVVEEVQEEAPKCHIALVTHGNVIHVLLRHLLKLAGPRSIRLPNCGCMELEHRHGGWMLRSMISPDMLDASLT